MNQFPHDNIKPFEGAAEKKQQVSEMFDQIAPRYDFMNRFLSVGIDVSWRIKAIKRFKKDNSKHLLDVATGTGDMAIRACKMLPVEKVTGIDISENMLSYGRQKIAKEGLADRIELLSGDSENIRFDDNTFDGVMVAFAYLFPNSPVYLYFVFPIKVKYLVIGYFLLDLFGGINPTQGDNVAHFAHVGGAIVGLILVITMNKSNRRTFY